MGQHLRNSTGAHLMWLWLPGRGDERAGGGDQSYPGQPAPSVLHQCHPVFNEAVEDLNQWARGRAIALWAELLAGNQGSVVQLEMKGRLLPDPYQVYTHPLLHSLGCGVS